MVDLEICVDTLEGVHAALQGGADCVELCSALALCGLTPSPGLMRAAAKVPIEVHAMIRPVAGGFVVSPAAKEVMLGDIATARETGLKGVVIGALTDAGVLDGVTLCQMIEAAGNMDVTLHRAIDLCTDPVASVGEAIELGFARILTSGGALVATEGADVITAMTERAGDKITIMAGSGVTPQNVVALVEQTGVRAVHASCADTVAETGGVAALGFGSTRRVTSADKVASLRQALDPI